VGGFEGRLLPDFVQKVAFLDIDDRDRQGGEQDEARAEREDGELNAEPHEPLPLGAVEEN